MQLFKSRLRLIDRNLKKIKDMKTNFRILFVLLLVTGVFSSCSCTVIGDSIKPSKNNITRDYKVKEFNQINAATVGDIYYTQSTDGKTTVQIYGPDNFVNLVQVAVKNGTLLLTMEKHNKIKNGKLKITIASPDLTRIDFKGVGDINIEDRFKTAKLDIECKGVGDIKINDLTCDELTINSKGVGDVELKGKVQSANLSSEGVGDIDADELEAARIEAFSKGVGDISCYATESLKASVKGVGSIKYKGNPTEKTFNKGGVGTIKNI